jgi:predicted ester cyclase
MKGTEGVKQYFSILKTAFPDYTEKIESLVGEGDLGAVFYTISGTFKGEYAGLKPTGKKFSGPAAVLAKQFQKIKPRTQESFTG